MMNKIIKERLALIQSGTIPHGYKQTKAGIMPEDWDGAVRAKDVFKNYTDKKHNGDLEILAATQENGIVPRSQIGIDIQCSEEGVNGYKKVSKGDFVISLRSFQGGIEYSEYDGIVSPAYTVLQPVREISDGYYRNYFKTDSFIQRLNGAVYGIRDGKQIGYQDFGDMCIYCPPIDEQKKIAEVLSCCDRVIELKQQLIAELQRLKSGFLQAMFPAKGHREPDIRFPEFSDAWEQRKLDDVAEFSKGSGYSRGDLKESGTPIILYGRLYTKYETIISDVDTFVEAKDGSVYSKGGEVIVPASGETAEDIARAASVDKSGILLGGDLNVVMPNEDINSAFLAISISNGTSQRELARKAQGKSVVHIHNEEIRNLVVPFPRKTEQNKIENYFADLDHLITLHQRELEETKKKKKSLAKLLLTGSVRVPT